MENIKSKVVLGLLFGVIVIVGLALAADLPQVLDAVRGFEWGWLPLILGLTSFNYLLRFVKWHYYLRQVGIDHIAWADSLKVFLGGFAMTVTPGKIGEAFKSLWLKNLTGAGMARTLPVVAAERLSDALACALLASVGVVAYPQYWPVFAAILAVLIGGISVIQIRALSLWLLGIAEHLPLVSRFAHSLHEFYEGSFELLNLKNLAVAVGLGTVSWAGEGAAFCLVLKGWAFRRRWRCSGDFYFGVLGHRRRRVHIAWRTGRGGSEPGRDAGVRRRPAARAGRVRCAADSFLHALVRRCVGIYGAGAFPATTFRKSAVKSRRSEVGG